MEAVQGKAAVPKVITTLDHDAVAKLAYGIWVEKGRVPGRDLDNWREAEAQLCAAVATR
jgi:hypothetical protein